MTTTIPVDAPDWVPAQSGATDQLIPYGTYTLGPTVPAWSKSVVVSKSYQAIVVEFYGITTPGVYALILYSSDPSGNVIEEVSTTVSLPSIGIVRRIFALPLTPGGTFEISVSGGNLNDTITVQVYGSTAQLVQGAQPMRSDGRPYPVGSGAVGGVYASAATVIAAPGAGQRIMLRDMSIGNGPTGSGSQSGTVKATVGGNVVDLVTASVAASGVPTIGESKSWNGGLLLDDNTAVVTQYSAAVTFTVEATYDVVS